MSAEPEKRIEYFGNLDSCGIDDGAGPSDPSDGPQEQGGGGSLDLKDSVNRLVLIWQS